MATMGANRAHRAWLKATFPHMRELAIIAGAYWVYMYTRALAFDDFGATALSNAAKIISLERSVGFFWEPEWQQWAISSAKALVVFFNWTYIVTFWPIILTAGTILYITNRPRYRYYRNIVLISFALAMVAFVVFPLAPPRMMVEHFVDSIKAFGPAFYAGREMASFYNPYAAMPSLHFGWTVMFGVLFLRTPNMWIKILGIVYPTMTLLAITITANHYISDAIGGALLMIAAFVIMELGFRRRLFLPMFAKYMPAVPKQYRVTLFQKTGRNGPLAEVVPLAAGDEPANNREEGIAPIDQSGDPA